MPETQNIEYKSSWHDDYLKWICGFANAQGGQIYIGKNDDGEVGIQKITDACKAAGLPKPVMEEQFGGFIVKLFKDIFSEEELQKLGLNERQIKAVLYVKEKGKITNGEYQEINDCSRATANRDLTELVQENIFLFNDIAGAGANYQLKIIAS